MHSLKMRRRIGCIILFSILLCEMCFHDQPCKAYFFVVQTSASISGTPIHISKERQIASFERPAVSGHGSFCAGAAAAEMHPVFEEYHLACLLWMFFHRCFIRQSIFGRKDVPTIQAGTSSAYGVCSGRMAKSEQFPDFQRRTQIANSLWIA